MYFCLKVIKLTIQNLIMVTNSPLLCILGTYQTLYDLVMKISSIRTYAYTSKFSNPHASTSTLARFMLFFKCIYRNLSLHECENYFKFSLVCLFVCLFVCFHETFIRNNTITLRNSETLQKKATPRKQMQHYGNSAVIFHCY